MDAKHSEREQVREAALKLTPGQQTQLIDQLLSMQSKLSEKHEAKTPELDEALWKLIQARREDRKAGRTKGIAKADFMKQVWEDMTRTSKLTSRNRWAASRQKAYRGPGLNQRAARFAPRAFAD